MKAEEFRKQLLAIFGIEPDEEFYTEQILSIYKHRYNSKFGYFEYYHKREKRWCHDKTVIENLLSGYTRLIRKFWKPEQNEMYFYISGEGEICSLIWWGDTFDLSVWHLKNCFKTREEAEENKEKILELLRSDIPVWRVANLRWGNE